VRPCAKGGARIVGDPVGKDVSQGFAVDAGTSLDLSALAESPALDEGESSVSYPSKVSDLSIEGVCLASGELARVDRAGLFQGA